MDAKEHRRSGPDAGDQTPEQRRKQHSADTRAMRAGRRARIRNRLRQALGRTETQAEWAHIDRTLEQVEAEGEWT